MVKSELDHSVLVLQNLNFSDYSEDTLVWDKLSNMCDAYLPRDVVSLATEFLQEYGDIDLTYQQVDEIPSEVVFSTNLTLLIRKQPKYTEYIEPYHIYTSHVKYFNGSTLSKNSRLNFTVFPEKKSQHKNKKAKINDSTTGDDNKNGGSDEAQWYKYFVSAVGSQCAFNGSLKIYRMILWLYITIKHMQNNNIIIVDSYLLYYMKIIFKLVVLNTVDDEFVIELNNGHAIGLIDSHVAKRLQIVINALIDTIGGGWETFQQEYNAGEIKYRIVCTMLKYCNQAVIAETKNLNAVAKQYVFSLGNSADARVYPNVEAFGWLPRGVDTKLKQDKRFYNIAKEDIDKEHEHVSKIFPEFAVLNAHMISSDFTQTSGSMYSYYSFPDRFVGYNRGDDFKTCIRETSKMASARMQVCPLDDEFFSILYPMFKELYENGMFVSADEYFTMIPDILTSRSSGMATSSSVDIYKSQKGKGKTVTKNSKVLPRDKDIRTIVVKDKKATFIVEGTKLLQFNMAIMALTVSNPGRFTYRYVIGGKDARSVQQIALPLHISASYLTVPLTKIMQKQNWVHMGHDKEKTLSSQSKLAFATSNPSVVTIFLDASAFDGNQTGTSQTLYANTIHKCINALLEEFGPGDPRSKVFTEPFRYPDGSEWPDLATVMTLHLSKMLNAKFVSPKTNTPPHPDKQNTIQLTQMTSGSADTSQLNSLFNMAFTIKALKSIKADPEYGKYFSHIDAFPHVSIMGDDNQVQLNAPGAPIEAFIRAKEIFMKTAEKCSIALNKRKTFMNNHVGEHMKRVCCFGIFISRNSLTLHTSERSQNDLDPIALITDRITLGMTMISRGFSRVKMQYLLTHLWNIKRHQRVSVNAFTYAKYPTYQRPKSMQLSLLLPFHLLHAPVIAGGCGLAFSGLAVSCDDAIYIAASSDFRKFIDICAENHTNFPRLGNLEGYSPQMNKSVDDLSKLVQTPTAQMSRIYEKQLNDKGIKTGNHAYHKIYERLREDVLRDGSLAKEFRSDIRFAKFNHYRVLVDKLSVGAVSRQYIEITKRFHLLNLDIDVTDIPIVPLYATHAILPISKDMDKYYLQLSTGGMPSGTVQLFDAQLKAFLASPMLPGAWTAEKVLNILTLDIEDMDKIIYLLMIGGTLQASQALVFALSEARAQVDVATSISMSQEADPIHSIINSDETTLLSICSYDFTLEKRNSMLASLRALVYSLYKVLMPSNKLNIRITNLDFL